MTSLFTCISSMLLLAGCMFGLTEGDLVQEAEMPHSQKADKVWKRYHNVDLGYCVDYPSRWAMGAAFDGSGLLIRTGVNRYSRPSGEIDVEPIRDDGPEDARLRAPNLEPELLTVSLQEHWDGLQKFSRAERLQVIQKRELKIQGYAALFAKNKYYDPLERRAWMEEVVFVNRGGEVYRLELQCASEQIERFEPVFAYLVKTLRFNCK